jgi:DNA-directed RNA polymerase subunit RPC12/RpoP
MKTCAFCDTAVEDLVMECPKCRHSRFIQQRTKAPSEKTVELKLPERTLSDLHLLILEKLQGQPGFLNASQFLMSLPFQNESQAQMGVMAIQDMVDSGLIEVSGRSKIKITAEGKETWEREKKLPPPKK